MAGRTNVLVGRLHGRWVHVPLALVSQSERRVDRDLWLTVREITGQADSRPTLTSGFAVDEVSSCSSVPACEYTRTRQTS